MKIRTQRILGRLLKENEVRRAGYAPLKKVESNNVTPPKPSLSDYGISKNESSTFQKRAKRASVVCCQTMTTHTTMLHARAHEMRPARKKVIKVITFMLHARAHEMRQEKLLSFNDKGFGCAKAGLVLPTV